MTDVLDFGSVMEDLDPSMSDGYVVLYDREVPFEIRNAGDDIHPNDPQDNSRNNTDHEDGVYTSKSIIQPIKVKILTLGQEDLPKSIRIELSSEMDLFFSYVHIIDYDKFQIVKNSQNLMVDFSSYASIIIKMLNSCIRESHMFLAVFTLLNENEAKLDLIQNMEYKYVELIHCMFERSEEEIVQQQITFRYNSMKQRLHIMQARVHEIVNLVKTKNPSLLLQLQKGNISNGNQQYVSTNTSVASRR